MIEKRDIVVILCDQLRPDFLSAYGGAGVPTPNIDRLAAAGVVFEHAITQSTVCAPVRATMMTGRYVSDHGVWTNDVPFRDGLDYLPQRMNTLGYRTGAFGKLHHFPADDSKGFGVAELMEEGRLGEAEPYLAWLKARHPEVTGMWNVEDGHFAFGESEYYEHWIADRAIEFIEQAAAEDPVFAWISFQGPHTPLDPPREVEGSCDTAAIASPTSISEQAVGELPEAIQYRRAADPHPAGAAETMEKRVRYCELIVEIDRQIGRVLDCLEATGRFSSTTVIFSGDHGDLLGDFDLKAKGPYPYAGQMDIPLIVSNHPDVPSGRRSDAPVGSIDIPGTCLAIAGDEEPIGYSTNLLSYLTPGAPHRDFVFCEFCDSVKTVDDGRFRLSYFPFEGARMLFDKSEDRMCVRNLSGRPEYADVEGRLLGAIIDSLVVAKGVRVEAHDFTPAVQDGVARINPHWVRDTPVAFPLSVHERSAIAKAALNADYNEVFRSRPLTRFYTPPYWHARGG